MNKLNLNSLLLILLCSQLSFTYAQNTSTSSASTTCSSPVSVQQGLSNPTYRNGYDVGYEKGIAFCKENPNACGISLNTASGRSEEEIKAEAQQACQNLPESCGITVESNSQPTLSACKTLCQENPATCGLTMDENSESDRAECLADARAQCQADPSACGIVITEDSETTFQDGINQCQNDPSSCGISVSQNDDGSTIEGMRLCQADPSACSITVYQNTDGSTQQGILQCQADPLSCGIKVSQNIEEAIQDTKTQCQLNPSFCGINLTIDTVSNPEEKIIVVHGFFSLSDGRLYLPAVDVPNTFDGTVTSYEVYMKMIPGRDPLSFSITSVIPFEE